MFCSQVADELCRERVGLNPCDLRREKNVLVKEFPVRRLQLAVPASGQPFFSAHVGLGRPHRSLASGRQSSSDSQMCAGHRKSHLSTFQERRMQIGPSTGRHSPHSRCAQLPPSHRHSSCLQHRVVASLHSSFSLHLRTAATSGSPGSSTAQRPRTSATSAVPTPEIPPPYRTTPCHAQGCL